MNRKQEKRFWSADQKRFVYSLQRGHLRMPTLFLLPDKTKEENVMVELITNVNNAVNGFVWGVPMLVLLVGTGILMTVLT